MKHFNNFENAFNWGAEVIKKGCLNAREVVSEQIYSDSNEFVYRDTGDMHDSGQLFSKFKKGIIIERTPYVRRRYYEGGKPGPKNRKAEPRWFDKTTKKYNKDYEKQIKACIDENKRSL